VEWIIDELCKPLDIDAVASAARTPEEAASICTASLLAIDIDNPSKRAYLGLLAARLKLDYALVKHLHATVEGATCLRQIRRWRGKDRRSGTACADLYGANCLRAYCAENDWTP
jgi:hypothetical protein